MLIFKDSGDMQHTIGSSEMHTKFLFEILKGRNHIEDLGIDGKMILKLFYQKGVGGFGQDSSGLG
jgi:hypothetical protein